MSSQHSSRRNKRRTSSLANSKRPTLTSLSTNGSPSTETSEPMAGKSKSKGRRKSSPLDTPTTNQLSITEVTGDIFDAPPGALLIHACNCMGSWGAGIAAAFKQRYPKAFDVYHSHCANTSTSDLVGTALLIPPSETDPDAPQHWIGCLMTSRRFGKGKDGPEQILENTGPAMHALMEAVAESEEASEQISEVRMCKINSGKFGIPWEDSKRVVLELEFGDESIPSDIVVYDRE